MKSVLKKILHLVIFFVLTKGISVAQNEIIFEENFNDNSRNWDVGLDSNEFSEIKDGKYYIENRDLNNFHWFPNNIPLNNLSAFSIETKIENIDTLNPNSTISLCISTIDKSENYQFQYCSKLRAFCIIKSKVDTTYRIVGWTNNSAINQKTNIVKIVRQKNILFFCINNVVLTHLQINKSLDDEFGFSISTLNKLKIDYLLLDKFNYKSLNYKLIDEYWIKNKNLIFIDNTSNYRELKLIKKKAVDYYQDNNYKKSILFFNKCFNYKLDTKTKYVFRKNIARINATNNWNNGEAYAIMNELYYSYFKDFEQPIFLDSNEVQLFYNDFGAIASRLGKTEIALDFYIKSLQFSTISNQSEIGFLYINIGNIYANKLDNINAIKYFEKGVLITEKNPNEYSNGYLNEAYRSLSLISHQLGLRENCFIYAKQLYQYASLNNNKDDIISSLQILSNHDDSTIAIPASKKAYDFALINNYYVDDSKINLIKTKAKFGVCDDNNYLKNINIKNLTHFNIVRGIGQACSHCGLFEKAIEAYISIPDTCTGFNLSCMQPADYGFLADMYYLTDNYYEASLFYSKVIKNGIVKLMNYNNLTIEEKEMSYNSFSELKKQYYSLFETKKLIIQTNDLINEFALNSKNLISKSNSTQKNNKHYSTNIRENEKLVYSSLNNSLKNELSNKSIAIDIRKYIGCDLNALEIYYDSIIHYTLLVIAKDTSFSIIIKNGSELEKQLSEYNKYSSGNLKYKKDSSSYQLFWAEIDKYLKGYDKVYICPDGVFSKINIESLYDKSQNQYVGDKYNIEIVRNLGDIVNRKDTIKPISNNETIVLMGGADYDNKPNFTYDSTSILAYNTTSLRDGVQGKLQYLPGTKKEVEVIGDLLKKQGNKTIIYTGKSASEENVKAIKKTKIWHIATHGFFLENSNDSIKSYQEPLLKTGLYLSGANITRKGEKIGDDKDDGVFTAFEALNLDLTGTELVVLSACGTGKGDVKDGEGIYGLPRAIMEAGAESVLMSMWNVDDIGTMEYMKRFYTFRSKGLTNRESYHKTIQSLKNDPEFNYPYYWASFILIDR